MSHEKPNPVPDWVWIEIKCTDGTILHVSRDGKRCRITNRKTLSASAVHPVEELSSLRDALAKVPKVKSVTGPMTLRKNANYGRLVHAHSKLQKEGA